MKPGLEHRKTEAGNSNGSLTYRQKWVKEVRKQEDMHHCGQTEASAERFQNTSHQVAGIHTNQSNE